MKTACDKGTQKEEIDLNGLSANIYIVLSYTWSSASTLPMFILLDLSHF